MDSDDKFLLWVIVGVVAFIASMLLLVFFSDSTTYDPSPWPNCVVKTVDRNVMFGPDSTTRELYCKVEGNVFSH